MSFEIADCCATLPRIVGSGYERKGSTKETPNGLKYYEAAEGVTDTDNAVVVFFDIVGPNQYQTDQQVDRISKGLGVKVVSPHWFGNDLGYTGALGPDIDMNDLNAWRAEHAKIEDVKKHASDIFGVLKNEGITKIHAVGFCWGGMVAAELATIPDFLASAGSIHGRKYDAAHAARVVVPFANLPSQNEGPQEDFIAALPAGIKEKSIYKLFGDVPHGFAAARGQWATDELHKKRAEEVIEDYVGFVQNLRA